MRRFFLALLISTLLLASDASKAPPLAPLLGAPPAAAGNESTAAKVELGKQLFFERQLSGENRTSCGTCHRPELRFADEFSRGWGPHGELRRRVPTLYNVGWYSLLMHDGRVRSLEEQAALPLRNPDEMALDPTEAVARISRDARYRNLFAQAFPDEEITWGRIAQALAAYQRTLVSYDSDLDRFLLGDLSALTARAKRGMALFSGEAGCIRCHNGPLLSDQKLHYIGVKEMLGDSPQGTRYKTPSLRDVEFRSSYFHNGEIRHLDQVLDFYEGQNRVQDENNEAAVLKLSPEQRADLMAFLQSLTGRVYSVDAEAAEHPDH